MLTTAVSALIMPLTPLSAKRVDDIYGPINLLKTMPTPFTTVVSESPKKTNNDEFSPLGIETNIQALHKSLSEKLLSAKLYLPSRMVLGQVEEFTVKAKPGIWVALAMADKDTGAKQIFGHKIRLGPDRKLVAIAKIPDNGVATLLVETPIEGDLIGEHLYFEAALWSKPDMSDVEIASCVPSEGIGKETNAVLVVNEPEHKRGLKIVPATTSLSVQSSTTGLGSGRP